MYQQGLGISTDEFQPEISMAVHIQQYSKCVERGCYNRGALACSKRSLMHDSSMYIKPQKQMLAQQCAKRHALLLTHNYGKGSLSPGPSPLVCPGPHQLIAPGASAPAEEA